MNIHEIPNTKENINFISSAGKIRKPNGISNELWTLLGSWEAELKFWIEEYQTLKGVSELYPSNKKKLKNRIESPFEKLEKIIKQQIPVHRESLRSFRVSLKGMSDDSLSLAGKYQEMLKLERKLQAFRRRNERLQLDFLKSIHREVPITIF